MLPSRTGFTLGLGLIGLSFLCASCSYDDLPPGVALSGFVTFEGKPIQDGLITFYPPFDQEGRGASSTIHNGYYSVPRREGPYPGPCEVQIVELEHSLGKSGKRTGPLVDSRRIPRIYNFYTTLRVDIPRRNEMVYLFDVPAEHRLPNE